jgi:Fe2+ or Zn2+ uptake regulation protein
MQDASPDYSLRLRHAGIKVTRIRLAILDLITERGRHMTADEITAALRSRGVAADRVTVYRNIDRMVQEGLMVAACTPGKAMRVGVCAQPGAGHHHHIVCERCGRVAETHGCPIQDAGEAFVRRVQEASGFRLTGHITHYIGVCLECRRGERT